MNIKAKHLFVAAAGLLLGASTGAWAHHSFASEFDVKAPLSFTGKVVKVEMINPHSWIHLEITKPDGSKEVWMVEGGSPNLLFRRGITKASIPVGSELKVEGFQSRDKANRAVGRTITFADGKALFFESTSVPDAAK
ncbi:MAG: DUF6152 family protein [Pseudomonadota bacterium]